MEKKWNQPYAKYQILNHFVSDIAGIIMINNPRNNSWATTTITPALWSGINTQQGTICSNHWLVAPSTGHQALI